MAEVPQLLQDRWRSGKHVGRAKPEMEVWVRRGRFNRGYYPWAGHDVGATIPTGHTASKPWQARFDPELAPLGDWKQVPNVLECRLQQDFDQNGITRFEIDIENVNMTEMSGIAGVYHIIERGYYSPMRGHNPRNRPGINAQANQWRDILKYGAQVVILQGYGADLMVPVLVGLTDDVELESSPDRLTIIGRDFGKTLTDQSVFGWVKDKSMREPIVFADRRHSDQLDRVGGGARASSSLAGHPPRYVLDDEDKATAWISDGHGGRDFTEWVDEKVPRGRYEDFYLRCRYEGMEVYASVYAKSDRRGHSYILRADGTKQILPEGWVDLGLGDVPGGHGGFPFVAHKNRVTKRGRHYRLGNESLVLGDGSIVRLSFRHLGRSSTTGKFHAGVRRFAPIKRKRLPEAQKKRWILVEDASDVVKVVLRWAGFKEWDVEDTNVRLADKLVFNRGDKLIDIIKKIQDLTGYVFFINDPAGDPLTNNASLGIPTFRSSRVIQNPTNNLPTIRDKEMLTGIKARFTDEPLAYPIRVRGKVVKKNNPHGHRLGADTVKRWQSFYHTPWAMEIGYLIKHVVHYEPQLRSQEECDLAARLIALNEALQAATGSIETMGNPRFELDDHVALFDTGTQLSTRLWVANRSSTFRRGENTSWKTTLSGSLVDAIEVQRVLDSINEIDFDSDDAGGPIIKGGQRQ